MTAPEGDIIKSYNRPYDKGYIVPGLLTQREAFYKRQIIPGSHAFSPDSRPVYGDFVYIDQSDRAEVPPHLEGLIQVIRDFDLAGTSIVPVKSPRRSETIVYVGGIEKDTDEAHLAVKASLEQAIKALRSSS